MFSQSCEVNDSIFTLEYADTIPPLSKAARAGDIENIKKLILKGCLPQTPDNRGWTAVHCCVAENKTEALKVILKLKSKSKSHLVNLATWENVTPLMIALKTLNPSLEMVKILLKAGADPKAYTYTKLSPLHLACLKKKSIHFVKLLVEFGADVNIQEELNLFTPLHFAVCAGQDLETIKFLISLSDLKLVNVYDRTAFLEACNSNFLEVVQIFIENDKNLVNCKCGITPLAYAALVGNLKMVELLIKSGADVNCRCKAVVLCKSSDSDLILLDKESFLAIHSSLTNIDVFKLLLRLTNYNELLQLEKNYYSFSLFVMVYGDETFFDALLQSDFPEELKTFDSQVLIKFIQCYPDMEEVVIKKFSLIFKYNFALKPEKVFENFYCHTSRNVLCRNFKFLNLLAQMGISSVSEFQIKSDVIKILESFIVECKDSEDLSVIRSTCELLLCSVLTLKQICRIVVRDCIRSYVKSDWLALKMVKGSNLPDSLKKFVLFES